MEIVLKHLDKYQLIKKVQIFSQSTFQFLKLLGFQQPRAQQHKQRIRINYRRNTVPKQTIDDLINTFKQLEIDVIFKQQIKIGQKFSPYYNLHEVFQQKQTILSHKQGEILLIDIWSIRCGPCQDSMQYNKRILQRNQHKYNNKKLRIITISVDSNKQSIQQRIISRGWNNNNTSNSIQHLTLLKWDDEYALIKDFEIKSIPYIILIDRQGVIVFSGNPQQINLQERINKLLEENTIETQKQTMIQTKQLLNEQFPLLCQQLMNRIEQSKLVSKILTKHYFQQQRIKKYQFCICLIQHQLQIHHGKILKNIVNISISIDIKDRPQLIQQIQLLFKQHNINSSLYHIQIHQVDIVSIPLIQQNSYCIQCNNKLTYPCYWCKWDQITSNNKIQNNQNQHNNNNTDEDSQNKNENNVFRCRQCVQKKPSQQQHKHQGYYSYNNNSILIMSPQYKQVYGVNLGNNLQPLLSTHNMITQQHNKHIITQQHNKHIFGCNVCYKSPQHLGQPRYICAICNFNHHNNNQQQQQHQYCDLCLQCVNSIIKGDKQTIQYLKSSTNHHPNHPLLRVLYNVNGYQSF